MASLFVGNLPWGVTAPDLRAIVERYGTVVEARVAVDELTGTSRGFGFVTVPDEEAPTVAAALDGLTEGRRSLRVNVCRTPRR